MAKYNKGILGGFSGNIANICGSAWKGRAVVRSAKQKQNGRATPAMQAQWNEMRKNAFLYKFFKVFQNDLILNSDNSLLTFQQVLYSLVNKSINYYPPTSAAYDLFKNKYVTDSRAFVRFAQNNFGDDFRVEFDESYHVEPFLADVHFCFYKSIFSDDIKCYHFKDVYIPDGLVISDYDVEFFNGDMAYGMAVVKIGDKVTNLLFDKSNAYPGDYGYDFDFEFYP